MLLPEELRVDGVSLNDALGRWVIDIEATDYDLPLTVSADITTSVWGGDLDSARWVEEGAEYRVGVVIVHQSEVQAGERWRAIRSLFRGARKVQRCFGGVWAEVDVRLLSLAVSERSGNVTRVQAVFRVPRVWWRAVESSTVPVSSSTDLVALASSSAPIPDAVIRAHGPVTSLTVRDENSGTGVAWEATGPQAYGTYMLSRGQKSTARSDSVWYYSYGAEEWGFGQFVDEVLFITGPDSVSRYFETGTAPFYEPVSLRVTSTHVAAVAKRGSSRTLKVWARGSSAAVYERTASSGYLPNRCWCDGNYIWEEQISGSTYRFQVRNMSGTVRLTFTPEGKNWGVFFGGGATFVNTSSKTYRFEGVTQTHVVDTGGGVCSGAAFDGTYVWISQADGTLRPYDPETLTLEAGDAWGVVGSGAGQLPLGARYVEFKDGVFSVNIPSNPYRAELFAAGWSGVLSSSQTLQIDVGSLTASVQPEGYDVSAGVSLVPFSGERLRLTPDVGTDPTNRTMPVTVTTDSAAVEIEAKEAWI